MKKEILKIAYKYILLLLVAALLCTGTVFARYTSQSSGSASVSVAGFNYTYEMGVDATEFANTDYYTDENVISGNAALHYITFTLDGTNADVDAQSTVTFSSDLNFIKNLAFQIVQVNGDVETAVTPQYVVAEFLEGNGDTSTHAYKYVDSLTSSTTYYDYGEKDGASDQIFTVTTDGDSYFNAACTGSSGTTVISLSSSTVTHSIEYVFGRGEETEVTETVGGNTTTTYVNSYNAPYVYVEQQVNTAYSNLSISLPEMLIADGESKTFRLYFTPTTKTTFSYTYTGLTDNSNLATSGATALYYNAEKVTNYSYDSASSAATATAETITVKVYKDLTTSALTYYCVDASGDVELSYAGKDTSGNYIYGSSDGEVYINISVGNFDIGTDYTGTATYAIDDEAISVSYPMTFNVIFAQAEDV